MRGLPRKVRCPYYKNYNPNYDCDGSHTRKKMCITCMNIYKRNKNK